jgi:putative transposase
MREKYPSDLTDKEWAFLEPLIPGGAKLGRPPKYSKREIVNAIFYLIRSGCSWRMIAHDLPPWRICYYYFMIWKRDGVWEDIHERLREIVRMHHGKKKPPPLRLWTRRVLKQLTTVESVAMMQANGLWAAKDTYLWTH